MKRIIKIIFICVIALISISCTENTRTKHYGGSMTIEVEPGMMVVNATFKDDDLWYFVAPMDDNYIPQTKKLIEKSTYGVFEGTIIFNESR
jgi:hypothetical protein